MSEQGPMERGDVRMGEVLIRLALLSNGRTTNYTASGGGEPDYTPTLGAHDAPAHHYAKQWDAAPDGEQRRRVYDAARQRLAHETRGPGTNITIIVESRAELDERIVRDGEGVAANELAITFRTSVTIVRKARAAAGRETEYGSPPRRPGAMTRDERDEEARRLASEKGMNARDIAIALGVSYDTVRRALGRRAG